MLATAGRWLPCQTGPPGPWDRRARCLPSISSPFSHLTSPRVWLPFCPVNETSVVQRKCEIAVFIVPSAAESSHYWPLSRSWDGAAA